MPRTSWPELATAEALLADLPRLLRDRDGASLRQRCEALPLAQLFSGGGGGFFFFVFFFFFFFRRTSEKVEYGERRSHEEQEEIAERAVLVYAFLSYAYLRAPGFPADDLHELPPSLAVPWAAAATFLGRALGLDYVATVLSNCSVAEGTQEHEGNQHEGNQHEKLDVKVGATFTGSPDEEHFYAVHARIETAAAPAVTAMLEALEASSNVKAAAAAAAANEVADPLLLATTLTDCLCRVAKSVRTVARLLPTMRSGCSPHFFYADLRHLLAGFDQPIRLRGPSGLVFDRVTLRGASGAQSPLLPCIDAFLGVDHAGPSELPEYSPSRVHHMPIAHRELLHALRSKPPASPDAIAAAVCQHRAASNEHAAAKTAAALHDSRAAVLSALAEFRRAHLALVKTFIVRPATHRPCPSPQSVAVDLHAASGSSAVGGATPPTDESSDSSFESEAPSPASRATADAAAVLDAADAPSPIMAAEVSLVSTRTPTPATRRKSSSSSSSKPKLSADELERARAIARELRGTGGSSMLDFLRGRLDDTRAA